MKLSDGAFRHVESELRAYHETLQAIEDKRNEILYSVGATDDNADIRSGRIGDPTGQRATALVQDRRLGEMERVAKVIANVYARLPSERQKLVQLRYWAAQKLTWDEIGEKIPCHRSTAIEWRNEIVNYIGERLGW